MNKTIDVHCHLMRFGPESQGFLHPGFLDSIQVRTYFRQLGMIDRVQWAGFRKMSDVARLSDVYSDKLVANIDSSSLDHVVILALDGCYDRHGRLDRENTHWYVDNDSVFDTAKRSSRILVGGSVNPLRRDWKDELDKCIESNVALIKWLPNVMGFDPGDAGLAPFYERLAEARIPILSHVGFEYAVRPVDRSYADLQRLRLPLEMGVTIIAAHCCGGRPLVDSRTMFNDVVEFTRCYERFYMDVSAMASIHRRSRLANALANPATRERLVYGTDYPIPVHRWAFPDKLGISEALRHERNPFDSDLHVKKAMGVDDAILSRGYAVINQRTPVSVL